MADKKKMSEKTDKRHRAKVTVGHDFNGDPIVKWVSGRTKKELEEAKREIRRSYVDGVEAIRKDITFGQFCMEWYAIYKEPNVSVATKQNYRIALEKDLLPVFGQRRLRAISANDLQAFMNSFSNYAASRTVMLKGILVNTFRLAYSQGIIDRDPTVFLKRPTAPPTKKRRALTDAERAAVLKVGREHKRGLLLLVLYYTGLRLGEACGLKWEDIDFRNRKISVRRDIDLHTDDIGKLKSKASQRDVPIPSELYDALIARRGIGWVFTKRDGQHLERGTAYSIWKVLMAAVLEVDPSLEQKNGRCALTAHYLRHNYASILYNAGVDVLTAQKFLGHATPHITLAIYTHLSKEKETADVALIDKAFENF